MFEVGEKYPV
ncbi:Basic amino acid permease, partial [Candida albicans P76067]